MAAGELGEDAAGLGEADVDALADGLVAENGPSGTYCWELPLGGDGKLDRSALPVPSGERPAVSTAYRASELPVEETLAVILAQVLELDRVGADDDFVEWGGDSLRAVRAATQIGEALGRRLPASAVLEHPTPGRPAHGPDRTRTGSGTGARATGRPAVGGRTGSLIREMREIESRLPPAGLVSSEHRTAALAARAKAFTEDGQDDAADAVAHTVKRNWSRAKVLAVIAGSLSSPGWTNHACQNRQDCCSATPAPVSPRR